MSNHTIFNNSNSVDSKPDFLSIKGFTFVELLIVIGVMGILTAGAITLINPSQILKRARDADRKSDLKQIQVALEIYRADQGTYPFISGVTVPGNCPASVYNTLVELDPDGLCPSAPTKIFLQIIPTDPKTKANYYYLPNASANGYTIYSCLENSTDPEKLSASTIPVAPALGTPIANALACPFGTTTFYGVVNQ